MKNDDDTEVKVIVDPSFLASFDGTQEELDQIIEQVKRMANSGELLLAARPLTEHEYEALGIYEQDEDDDQDENEYRRVTVTGQTYH